MNNLFEDLINTSMLYVSRPCADIIRNSSTTRYGIRKMIKSKKEAYT